MERLTERYEDYVMLKELNRPFSSEEERKIRHSDDISRAIIRLAEYEDSGLTPEEVMEITKEARCLNCEYFETKKCVFKSTNKLGFCSEYVGEGI